MSGFVVKSNFFGKFKTGDNVNYNLETLNYFYYLYDKELYSEKKKLLIKPIVIWLMAITEAVLHDFYKRIRINTIEGVINLPEEVINYVRNRKIEELEKYISIAKNHDFFNLRDTEFYDKLDKLRLIRNRIHIQNSKLLEPEDENLVFTEDIKELAEKCTEKVVKTMSAKYFRPSKLSLYVSDMHFPWKEHFLESNY